MRERLFRALRSVAAVVAGYAVVAAGTTLGFEVLLGGIGYYKSSAGTLLVAGAVAVLSGVAGGLAAAWLAGRAPVAHAAGVLVFLAIDTAVVLWRGGEDPVWFDAGGSLTLMVSALAGGLAYRMLRHPAVREAAAR